MERDSLPQASSQQERTETGREGTGEGSAVLFDYIKAIVDEGNEKGQFFLSASQSLKLMVNIGDSLAGRAGIIKMLGISIRELTGSS
jgi:predicted AAA+ superfamily ATPase